MTVLQDHPELLPLTYARPPLPLCTYTVAQYYDPSAQDGWVYRTRNYGATFERVTGTKTASWSGAACDYGTFFLAVQYGFSSGADGYIARSP